MAKKTPANKYLLPILLAIIIAITSFIANLGRSPQLDDINPASPTPPLLITEPVDTKTWKRFSNTRYGFSFLYPEEWQLADYGLSEQDTRQLKDIRVSSYSPPKPKISGAFSVKVNFTNKTGFVRNCADLESCIKLVTTHFPSEAVTEDLTFMGNVAKRITYTLTDYNQTFSNLFVILDDDFYEITTTSVATEYKESQAVFDEILNSFTLTE